MQRRAQRWPPNQTLQRTAYKEAAADFDVRDPHRNADLGDVR